jgi:hypothetical protein
MEFISMAQTAMSVPSPSPCDSVAFGIPEEQPPRYLVPTEGISTATNARGLLPGERPDGSPPILTGLSDPDIDVVDPLLLIKTPTPEPMDGLAVEALQLHEGQSHEAITSAATEVELAMAESPPDGLGSVIAEDQSTAGRRKVTRIVIKVPQSRGKGTTKYSQNDDKTAYERSPIQNDVYPVDCLVDKWGKNWFCVKWFDGTYTWEPRENIQDKKLIEELNKEHKGLNLGVEVLRARKEPKGVRYLLR